MGYGIIAEELTASSLLQIRRTNEIQLILKCTLWSPCFTSFAYYLFNKLKLYMWNSSTMTEIQKCWGLYRCCDVLSHLQVNSRFKQNKQKNMVIVLEIIYFSLKRKWRLEEGTCPPSTNFWVQMPSRHRKKVTISFYNPSAVGSRPSRTTENCWMLAQLQVSENRCLKGIRVTE